MHRTKGPQLEESRGALVASRVHFGLFYRNHGESGRARSGKALAEALRLSSRTLTLAMSAALVHDPRDLLDSQHRILVLPDPHGQPTGRDQEFICLPISLNIAFQLGSPVAGVGLGIGGVVGAAMPKAAVDEDGHACGAEDDVGGSTYSVERAGRHTVAEPSSVEEPPKCQFWPGVPRAVCPHDPATSW